MQTPTAAPPRNTVTSQDVSSSPLHGQQDQSVGTIAGGARDYSNLSPESFREKSYSYEEQIGIVKWFLKSGLPAVTILLCITIFLLRADSGNAEVAA